jgi:hypothetical protein
MTLNLSDILKNGATRTLARNGLLLVGLLFVLNTVNQLLGIGVARWIGAQEFLAGQGMPVGRGLGGALFAIPPAVGGLLSFALGIGTILVTIAAIRTFVGDDTETLRREDFTRNAVWAGLNLFVGLIVYAIAVGLGFAALVVPGLFLLVALAFWSVFVAVEDLNFVEGFRESWGLTRGHRLELFLLGVAVALVSMLVTAAFGIPALIGGLVGVVFAQAASALTTVFTLATLAQAYNGLKAEPASDDEMAIGTGTPGPEGTADSV